MRRTQLRVTPRRVTALKLVGLLSIALVTEEPL